MALKISEITATVTDITKETLVEVSEETDGTYATKKFNLQGLAKAQHSHGYNDLSGVAPSEHTHGYDDLTGIAPSVHTHALGDLSGVDIETKADGDALVYVSADEEWKAVNLRKVNEIIKSSTATLTAAEVTGTIINNYGQTDNITLTLPTAAKGLTFMVVLGTTATDKYFRIKAGTNDQIYLSGTGGGDNKYVGVASAKVGYTISFSSFQTGESTYDWLAIPIVGNWLAEVV